MNESNNASSVVSKVWGFASMLRDDGVGYGDYLEQLTYLLFLKMADEYSKPPYNRKLNIPQVYDRRVSDLPPVGLMRIKDAETGHEQWIDTSSKAVLGLS